MHMSRRDFLRYVGASAAALALSPLQLERVEEALAATSSPPVIWLVGSACSGCSVSLMNAVNPTVDQVLLNTISLKYHPTLMTAAGELAVKAATSTAAAGDHILVVEGGIPTGESGRYCTVWDEAGVPVTMADAVRKLASKARLVVAAGTCAAYGGVPSAFCGTNVKGVRDFLGGSVVNVPGCPPHPDWMIGTLAAALSGQLPQLDNYYRPVTFYKREVIHERCPRKDAEEASQFGQRGRCLEELGCKGPISHADCDLRLWNNRQGWCIGANALCIGCTEPSFPAFPLNRNGEVDDDALTGSVPCVQADLPKPGALHNRVYLPTIMNSME
jgi:hydrogenase small subunit